jgi:hypothetical protein
LSFGQLAIHWSTERTSDEQDAGIFAFERRYRGNRAMVILNTNIAFESETSAEDLGFERMTTTFAPGTRLVDVMPGNAPASYVVSNEGCDTVVCEQPVADAYADEACGCLLVEVPPSGGRVLIEEGRVVEFDDDLRISTRDPDEGEPDGSEE